MSEIHAGLRKINKTAIENKEKSPVTGITEDNPLPFDETPEEFQSELSRTDDTYIIPQNKNNSSVSIEEIKQKNQWVCWQYEERDGNQTKIPYNPKTGGKAQSNDPSTWIDFNFALEKSNNYSGIGLMFADGICGIDIDNKNDDPEFDKQAETIINLMDAYTERSPSGLGYHIIFKCDISKIPQITVKEKDADGKEIEKQKLDDKYYVKNIHNEVECYFAGLTNRYFTYTGEIIRDKFIEDRTEQVLIFLDNYMLKDNFRKEKKPPPMREPLSDNIIDKIRKSKQGVKFSALFDRGDLSSYNNDDSAADQALCNIFAFWLQGDINEIDRYFRQSALYRDKWERADYRTSTINNAIKNCGGKYYNLPGRPQKKKDKKGYTQTEQEQINKATKDYGVFDEEKITIAGVAFYLESKNITVRYNETTRKINIVGLDKYGNYYIIDNFPIVIYNDLNLLYKRCSVSIIQDFLKVITMSNAYNPVLEIIENEKWDGVDRLPELCYIIRLKPDDTLSHTLIKKWYWQNLSMLRNNKGEYGADGILVIKGGQGIGKTTLARKSALKNEFFGEGLLLDVRDKDTIIRAVSCWIGELGEIESTFKSDINALKSFITNPTDKYRLPYGRTAEDLPRRTSFIGTCNSDEYLIDETGNRRYWTISIDERMDLEALEKFDMLQLYLQINEYAKHDVQGFRLTPGENKQLAERNSRHEKPLKAEFEIRDILFRAEKNNLFFEEITITEFKEKYPALKNYAANQISAALKKVGIITESKKRDGKTQRLAMLPTPNLNISCFP